MPPSSSSIVAVVHARSHLPRSRHVLQHGLPLVHFENFNIEFDPSFQNTWYDPKNYQTGRHAVLNLADPKRQSSILGTERDVDYEPTIARSEPTGTINYGDVYIGEPAISLCLPPRPRDGRKLVVPSPIAHFKGAQLHYMFGPWNVTCNTDPAVPANTYSLGLSRFIRRTT